MAQQTKLAEYRRLGSSGLKVSVPILGAMSFGSSEWGQWVLNVDESVEIMKAAWDRGINTIDTANVYSNGQSEISIGVFIKKYNIPRNQILILTKCFNLVAEDLATRTYLNPGLQKEKRYVNQAGLSRAAIFNQVDASLKRLGTDYIDLLQIHRFDPDTPAEETMKALHDLVQSGKVRYIGASSMRTWQFALLNEVADKNGWTKFISMQNEYSLMYREEEREMLPYCAFNGIGVIPWGPINAGYLTRPVSASTATIRGESAKDLPWTKPFTEAEKVIITRVEEVAKKRGLPMAKIALAWVAARVSSPIVGISSIPRIDEAIEASELELTDEEKKYLEEAFVQISFTTKSPIQE